MIIDDEDFEPIVFHEVSLDEIRHNILWFVTLSNEQRVYSKPGRRSWLELKAWLKEHRDINISALHFQFRDNFVEIGRNADGYFFSHGLHCFFAQNPQFKFIGGYVKDGIIFRRKYIVPEFVFNSEDQYPIDDVEMRRGLILNGKNI